jgi:NADH dehydrogenase FAD-containing subunit
VASPFLPHVQDPTGRPSAHCRGNRKLHVATWMCYKHPTGIDFKTGTTVTEVDTKAKQLKTQSGDTIGYDKLIVATGSKMRRRRRLSSV